MIYFGQHRRVLQLDDVMAMVRQCNVIILRLPSRAKQNDKCLTLSRSGDLVWHKHRRVGRHHEVIYIAADADELIRKIHHACRKMTRGDDALHLSSPPIVPPPPHSSHEATVCAPSPMKAHRVPARRDAHFSKLAPLYRDYHCGHFMARKLYQIIFPRSNRPAIMPEVNINDDAHLLFFIGIDDTSQ